MIHEKFFISDTHFFHNNILKFKRKDGSPVRPFDTIDAMHEAIVENWNSRVGTSDYVYHLGDVTFQYDKPFRELMFSLNGRKRLILGNHDRGLKDIDFTKFWEKIMLWHGFKAYDFTEVHIPLALSQLRDGKFCVHGHTHQNKMDDSHYINVCVETRDYAPVHLDTILKEINEVNKC